MTTSLIGDYKAMSLLSELNTLLMDWLSLWRLVYLWKAPDAYCHHATGRHFELYADNRITEVQEARL
jgi:hypothetical protein